MSGNGNPNADTSLAARAKASKKAILDKNEYIQSLIAQVQEAQASMDSMKDDYEKEFSSLNSTLSRIGEAWMDGDDNPDEPVVAVDEVTNVDQDSTPQAVGTTPNAGNAPPEEVDKAAKGKRVKTYAGVVGRDTKVRCIELVRKLDRKPLDHLPVFSIVSQETNKNFQNRVVNQLAKVQKLCHGLMKRDTDMYELNKKMAVQIDFLLTGAKVDHSSALETVKKAHEMSLSDKEKLVTQRQLKIMDIPKVIDSSNGQLVLKNEIDSVIEELRKWDEHFNINDIEVEDDKVCITRLFSRYKSDGPPKIEPILVTLKEASKAKEITEAYRLDYNNRVDLLGFGKAGKRKIQLSMTKLQRKAQAQAIKEVKEKNQELLDKERVDDTKELKEIYIVKYPDGNPITSKVFNREFWDYRPRDEYVENKKAIDDNRKEHLKEARRICREKQRLAKQKHPKKAAFASNPNIIVDTPANDNTETIDEGRPVEKALAADLAQAQDSGSQITGNLQNLRNGQLSPKSSGSAPDSGSAAQYENENNKHKQKSSKENKTPKTSEKAKKAADSSESKKKAEKKNGTPSKGARSSQRSTVLNGKPSYKT